MGLLAPLARVTMADDGWYTGDGVLSEVEVAIGEQDRSNSCSFTLSDWNGAIAAKYFEVSFELGGIEIPPNLLSAPGANPASGSGGGGTASSSNFGGATGDELASALIAECQRQGITDPNQIAYVLATAQLESGMGQYLEEFADGSAYEGRADLGNTQAGDGVRFKGRGYVQITGRVNYQDWSDRLGVDFVSNPELMEQPNYALTTIVVGMRDGTFTGKKLSDYIPAGGSPDFVNARRIINGTDKASLIAGYANDWLARIPELSSGSVQSPPVQPEITDVATTQPNEVSQRGTEIIIEVGFEVDQLISYHFIHTGTKYNRSKQETTFEGKAVRYILSRRNRNTSYGNITLRELAQQVCDRYRLTLEMEGDGPTYQHLDQTGISDYQLLLRECRAIGYFIKESGATLTIKPMRPEFTGFVINHENCIDLSFSDQASADRIIPAPDSVTTRSEPTTDAAENTAQIDRLTGNVIQQHEEDTTGTGGDRENNAGTTGSPDQAIAGTPQQGGQGTGVAGVTLDDFIPTLSQSEVITPDELQRLKAQGFTDDQIQEIYRRQAFALENEAAKNASQTLFTGSDADVGPTEDEIEATTEIPADFDRTLLIGADELATLQASPVGNNPDQLEELYLKRYKQWLRDNKEPSDASASTGDAPGGGDARSEAHRVGMGYQSQAELIMLPETLIIEPGSVIAISNTIVPEVFAREWRVSQVRHSLSGGGIRTTLDFYSPVAVRASSPASPAAGGGSVGPLSPGSWVLPADGPIGDGIGPRSPTRNHNGIDIATAGPMLASGDGVVVSAAPGNASNNGDGANGGAGNMIVIEHADGVFTRYMHMAPGSFTVSEGEQVTAGQQIGTCGNSGRSFGAHAHVEWRKGSQTGTVMLPSDFGIVITQDMLSQPGDWTQFKY